MADSDYQIDSLDRDILGYLQKDARTPFLEIARELGVSGGTIHQRVDRLRSLRYIKGSTVTLDPARLGYGVKALIGIHLNRAQDYPNLVKSIQRLPAVVEANYTTGTYALLIKVFVRDMQAYYDFLTNKLQAIEGVRATESFICIDTPIERSIAP